jgi:predicted RNase H-like nuclease (RuvC/YqgF family)
MNENQEKITNAQIIAEQEKLKQKYETEIKAVQQENLSLQNTILKKDDEIFELQKDNEGLSKDRDEWKTEARRNRRIEQESKQVKEANDFKSKYIKLQEAKRGWTWNETKGWVTK